MCTQMRTLQSPNPLTWADGRTPVMGGNVAAGRALVTRRYPVDEIKLAPIDAYPPRALIVGPFGLSS